MIAYKQFMYLLLLKDYIYSLLKFMFISDELYCQMKYFLSFSVILDIQVMLFVGFGFLMTFLRRFGYSAVCFTMLLIVFCVEYAILVKGFT